MSPKLIVAIAAGVVCVVCLFVAVERYQSNADTVRAMNRVGGGLLRSLSGSAELTPATPAATKYAIFFALLSGGVSTAALILHNKEKASGGSRSRGQRRS